MILVALLLIPFIGGALALLAGRAGAKTPRRVALAFTLVYLVLTVIAWLVYFGSGSPSRWAAELDVPWVASVGIHFHLGLDGLSMVLLLLTGVLGVIAVAAAWDEISERPGFFYFNLLWVLAGITGIFLALDLFLFYFFWEMMLVPMYFLIAIWGHENRTYASVKFFLFTQASGLLMLLSILGLYYIHGQSTGTYTFDYNQLLGTRLPAGAATWLMLGFLIAFVVKLPMFLVHTWLPDAHTEAPTAGSIILAGLLLKNGAYGLIRFVVPLFPDAARSLSPLFIALGIAGILYGAVLAYGQTDFKRLVAYTSVSHMGFVLLAVFVWNQLALQGAVIEMVCHGISTGALFAIVGMLQERIHTRDMQKMGGLWAIVPRMGAATLLFALAGMGLPGLGNFVGEFLILLGAYQYSIWAAALAALGLIVSTVYSLRILQRAFYGPAEPAWRISDLNLREIGMLAVLTVLIVWLGLYPQPVLNTVQHTLNTIQPQAAAAQVTLPGTAQSNGGNP
jgi:NADH-quinone oxidoreductase subunit M